MRTASSAMTSRLPAAHPQSVTKSIGGIAAHDPFSFLPLFLAWVEIEGRIGDFGTQRQDRIQVVREQTHQLVDSGSAGTARTLRRVEHQIGIARRGNAEDRKSVV